MGLGQHGHERTNGIRSAFNLNMSEDLRRERQLAISAPVLSEEEEEKKRERATDLTYRSEPTQALTANFGLLP